MIVDIVDKYCTDDNNPIKNLRLKICSKIISYGETQEAGATKQKQCPTVLGIRIRSTGVRWFLGLPDPDPDSTLIFSDSQDQEKYKDLYLNFCLFPTVGTFTSVLKTFNK